MTTYRTLDSPIAAEVIIDGRRYTNFGGSSYLGLSGNPAAIDAGLQTLRETGCGYQLPRHYGMSSRAHQDVELEAATFFDTPAAMYLSGGYYFGLVAMAALRQKITRVFFDELAHYSLRESIDASALPSHVYRHLDAQDLECALKRHMQIGDKPLVVTDGLFSTLGEIAPLDELARVASPYEGRLLVDESHSFGVLGTHGRGAAEHHDLSAALTLRGGSLSKAFGASGGLIIADNEQVATLRATPAARGAAAGLPAAAAMCAFNLQFTRRHPELLIRLRENIRYLKSGLRRIGLDVGDTAAPIATFTAGSGSAMEALAKRLMSDGIVVLHSNYIGAGAGGVIRCGIFADHTQQHLDQLLEGLKR